MLQVIELLGKKTADDEVLFRGIKVSEQERKWLKKEKCQWEAAQIKHSTFRTGVLDKEQSVDDCEYGFDERQTNHFLLLDTMSISTSAVLSLSFPVQFATERTPKRKERKKGLRSSPGTASCLGPDTTPIAHLLATHPRHWRFP